LQGTPMPGNADTASYILFGLAAANYAPDPNTDALARFLYYRQRPDGCWQEFSYRPPLESGEIEVTATSLLALQKYAPQTQRAQYEESIKRAAGWLKTVQPHTYEDRAFQLLGLGWAGVSPRNGIIIQAVRELLAQQRPDGGWAQGPSLPSDAYATGQALVALNQAGGLPLSHSAWRRGMTFLLKTQLADGSWYVRSRAIPIQPFFQSGFPHERDQWISAAGTNWATMALTLSLPGKTGAVAPSTQRPKDHKIHEEQLRLNRK
jgi:squalene cyclase